MTRAGWFTRWRRRHRPPFDWAERIPELRIPAAAHVRLVSQYPPTGRRP